MTDDSLKGLLKKLGWLCGGVAAVALVFIVGTYIYMEIQFAVVVKKKIAYLPMEYQQLANNCIASLPTDAQKERQVCCLESLERMHRGGYTLAPRAFSDDPARGCGYTYARLHCAGSLEWCDENSGLDPIAPESVLLRMRKEDARLPADEPTEKGSNSREKLAGYFFKDESSVYWHHFKLTDVDPVTFVTLNDQYAYDKNNVYYQGYTPDNTDNNVYAIHGADVATFQVFGNGYAKDKYWAYYRGDRIAGADPESFVALGPVDVFYAKDRNVVYHKNQKIDGFEPASFRIADKSSRRAVYLVDDKRVGMEVWANDQVGIEFLEGVDPATFEILAGWWGRDKDNVFYRTNVVDDADPATFEVMGKWEGEYIDDLVHAKDKDSVYYLGKRIAGADPNSFQEISDVQLLFGSFGKDKNSAYKNGEPFPRDDLAYFQKGKLPLSVQSLGSSYYRYQDQIYYLSKGGHEPPYFSLVRVGALLSADNADAATFQVLKYGYARDRGHVYLDGNHLTHDPDDSFTILEQPYSKTKHLVFLGHYAIEGALPDSFEILSLGYAKDAQSVFQGDTRVVGADPATFEVLGKGLSSHDDDWGGGKWSYNYARDAESVFCEEYKLTDADPETFILKGTNGMPEDQFRRYDGCEVVE